MTPGKFITFEGIDGCGKSTAAKAAADYLKSQGVPTLLTRQPGGTTLGEGIREILLHKEGCVITPITEVLLFSASFRTSYETLILPALEQGVWVLSDRWTDSTRAYQCGGRGLGDNYVDRILEAAAPSWPDLRILFDLPAEEAAKRVGDRKNGKDRIEAEGLRFMQRVRNKYKHIWNKKAGGKKITIDSERWGQDECAKQTIAAIKRLQKGGT